LGLAPPNLAELVMAKRLADPAMRNERSEARRDTQASHYEHKLQTKAGEVKLRVPKLRTHTFETAIIESLPSAREFGRGKL
jgi:transposase-like protein